MVIAKYWSRVGETERERTLKGSTMLYCRCSLLSSCCKPGAWKIPGQTLSRCTAYVRYGLLLLGLCILWVPSGLKADATDPARAALAGFLEGLVTLRAQFLQTLTDETGFLIQEATGRLYLALPDRLYWEIIEPFQQIVLADGRALWVYDPELRQATAQTQDAAQQALPLMVLTQPERIEERFSLQSEEIANGYRLLLTPLEAGADFTRIDLQFTENLELYSLAFIDIFGQRTLLRMVDQERNPDIEPEQFTLQLPPGTDVFWP